MEVISTLVGVAFGFFLSIIYDRVKHYLSFKSYLRMFLHEIETNLKIIDEGRDITGIPIEPTLMTTAYSSLVSSGYLDRLPHDLKEMIERVYGLIFIRNGLLTSGFFMLTITFEGKKTKGHQIVSEYTSIIKDQLLKLRKMLINEIKGLL